MAAITTQQLGKRIRELRIRAGMSQAELAERISMERTVVNKIESGVRKVSAMELADIAMAIEKPMTSFFKDPTPAVAAHRARAGVDVEESTFDSVLTRLAEDVEFVQQLKPKMMTDLSQSIRQQAGELTDLESVIKAAETTRKALGVTADEPLVNLSESFSHAGLLLFSDNLGKNAPDAGCILLKSGCVGLVNSDMKVGRRRLAAAHEFGHFLAQDDYRIDWQIESDPDGVEGLMDRFARELLLPKAAMNEWSDIFDQHGLRRACILIASRYQVDMATLARRIKDFDPSFKDSQEVRSFTTTKTDIVEFNLVVSQELEGRTQPREYQRAVTDLVRSSEISAEKALQLLWQLFEEFDLPEPVMDYSNPWSML